MSNSRIGSVLEPVFVGGTPPEGNNALVESKLVHTISVYVAVLIAQKLVPIRI